jgi:hypothetical protein
LQPFSVALPLKNPLDPAVPIALPRIQPEAQIPLPLRDKAREYCVFVPPLALAACLNPVFTLKVSLLFGAFFEYNRHGLRTFFAGLADRALVVVEGVEASGGAPAWGVGITTDMVRQLLTSAGVPATTSFTVDTIAGYSTGYRGVNGTLNNKFLPAGDVKRLIFYDALFWGDEPAAPAGTVLPPTPAGISTPLPASPRNTWRMLNGVRSANPGVEIITYEVTEPNGTPRDAGKLRVDVPSSGLINLKLQRAALTALALTRILDSGARDGYFATPPSVAPLVGSLPARGTLASSPLTAARATSGTLANWAATLGAAIGIAAAALTASRGLINTHGLMGWAPPDDGSLLHDAFMQEFGWEFLAGP